MMLRKLTATALIVGLAACAGFAQGKAKGAKAEANSNPQNVSRSFVMDHANVDAYNTNVSLVTIIDVGEADADPIKLDRSFKDALKENLDKESFARLSTN